VVLVGADASEDSATLVDRLIGYWRKAVDLFDTITMRAALGKLAGELQARRRMTGEEIAAVVVDAEALRAARASLE
jgi:hypothetical protein